MKNSPSTTIFDQYSQDYKERLNHTLQVTGKNSDFFAQTKVNKVLRLCSEANIQPSKAALVDLGCGTGEITHRLSEVFGSVSGIDVSAHSIEVARSRCPHASFSHYSGGSLPTKDESFDVALIFCVLHHIPVPDRTLFMKETYRSLKPGGLCLICEHNPFNPFTQHIVRNCEFDDDAILLKRGETLDLLSSTGFIDLRSHYTLIMPVQNELLRTMEDRMLGDLPLGAQYFAVGKKQSKTS